MTCFKCHDSEHFIPRCSSTVEENMLLVWSKNDVWTFMLLMHFWAYYDLGDKCSLYIVTYNGIIFKNNQDL